MPPPAFGRTASDPDSGGFKRTPSAQNVDAITMRLRIVEAFKETDSDGSGTVEPEELTVLLEKLEIDLKDKVNDSAVIFQTMDPDRNGHISEKEWISCFEPAIKQREADGQKKMDFDDIMKDTFNKVLEDSRAERAVVIESFMKAYEQVKYAFGKKFMTNNWRFAIYDAFYSVNMVLPEGEERIAYLKRRLKETTQKDLTAENWAREALEDGASNLAKQEAFVRTKSVEDSIKTVKDVSIIKEFCEAWLQELAIVEKRVAAEANAK